MRRISGPDRVKMWNTFFKLAWGEAKVLFEKDSNTICKKSFKPAGGVLGDEDFHILATLILCNLAIEARANHLIDELFEKGIISEDEADAAQYLPIKNKWALLPKLAGKRIKIDFGKPPHSAISQICVFRNDLMHVRYFNIKKKLPKLKTLLSYFNNFVIAMENMNVILGRINKPRKTVLNIGSFA
jgi:hypothetical protein